MKNTSPMANEVQNTTLIANFAAFAFPLPNSFETRTLQKKINFGYMMWRWQFMTQTPQHDLNLSRLFKVPVDPFQ